MTRIQTLLTGAALGLGMGFTGAASADPAEKLVTVVTSADAQTQLMAMVLTAAAVEQGAQTRILLCGAGGDLALKDAPASATAGQPPRGASPQGLMQAMMGNGVTVEVCAIYLPGKGADASILLEGVGVAQPPAMAGAMRDSATSVWSF
jgi:predicted peroxiredoxin